MAQDNGKAGLTTDEGWMVPIDPANPGLGRRTVLAGAAWSVPVIAAAIATPLAAASAGTPTLEFGGPYTVDGCGTLTGVTVTATTDGTTAAPGTPVVVSLPAGFTWADGTIGTKTVTTGINGQAIVPDIIAPATGGTFTLNGTGNGTTAVGTITATAAQLIHMYDMNTGQTILRGPISGTPAKVDLTDADTAQTYGTQGGILTTDGNLYNNGGTLIATGVTDFDASRHSDGHNMLTYVTTDGTIHRYDFQTGQEITRGPISGTPVKVALTNTASGQPFGTQGGILTSDGNLYNNAGTLIATGVTDFDASLHSDGHNMLTYVTTDGTIHRYDFQTGQTVTQGSIPGSLVKVDLSDSSTGQPFGTQGGILTSDGNLYNNAGTLIDTGVTDFDASLHSDGHTWLTYTTNEC